MSLPELWILTGHLPGHSNPNRPITSHTLHCRDNPSLLISHPHMLTRTIWLTSLQPRCQRSLTLFHLHLPTHPTRHLLQLLPIQGNLKHRHHSSTYSNSNSFRGLHPTLMTNVVLKGYSHHQPILRDLLHRTNPCQMSLRGLFSRQPNMNLILHPILPPTIFNCRPHPNPPHLPP
uniref:Uncharacterized protein n=1 Tax=Falco tinnunculus TaxID=100819 RepID=A0A8C4TT66_FALTI